MKRAAGKGRLWLVPLIGLAALAAASVGSAAQARGFVSLGVNAPLDLGPPDYYPPPAYPEYPPPGYYEPPPRVVYDDPPYAYREPPPPYQERRTCREYQTEGMIGGRREQLYGTVCLQPDGSWQLED